MQNGATTSQVGVKCAGAPQGPDPILNTTSAVAGSGHTNTVTGTVSIEAVYKDGQTYAQLGALQPNLSGIQTCQFVRDTPLNNLGSGQVFRNKVSFLHKIPWLWIAIVDGNQRSKFAATSNLQLTEN